jgi:hypothetical protein
MTSIIKVDNLQNQCGANIINENAGTITIGASGDTVTLAAGASQSGFGRSGSVNWDTTPKTTGFTAVSGNGYFCDTTSAAFTVTLPAGPSAGDIVAIADYNGTAITNNITVGRNSSDINGSATDLTISVNYSAVTLVYVDATSGWRSVDSSNPNDIVAVPEYVLATGGTITTCGDYKIHSFTGPGTFTVTSAGNPLGSATVDYLVVAGGGAGSRTGGGGGAGGFRISGSTYTCASPLANPTGLPVSVQPYPITVGGGGAAQDSDNIVNNPGNPSVFSTITSTGGGGGSSYSNGPGPGIGANGGSGGGGGTADGTIPAGGVGGGTGNTPPTSPSQGNNGGTGSPTRGGGAGGGAGAVGGNSPGPNNGGVGGAGSFIPGPALGPAAPGIGEPGPAGRYLAGGGGGTQPAGTAAGGLGGGGDGGPNAGIPAPAKAGVTNTGGGGAGISCSGAGTGGGSGIVIIRYKFQ